jgi:hypothetical protein
MNSFTKIPAALAIAFLVVAPFHAAWAGCKSDYADAIETCRSMYDEPNDADDLALCVQTAKDDYDSCIG